MSDGEARGAGDRWLAGERVDGVELGHHALVEVVAGRHAGRTGRVQLLLALTDDPVYLVSLDGGGGEARLPQSVLRARA